MSTNRELVMFLAGAIVVVLAVGVWLLMGQKQVAVTTEPTMESLALLGEFYLPAEFEDQEILYLGGEQLARRHPTVMADVVREAATEVPIAILAGSTQGHGIIDSLLTAKGLRQLPVEILRTRVQTMWVRDFGPLTVTDTSGRRSMVEFQCGERRAHRFDDDIPAQLAVQMDLAILSNGLQVTGGDLTTNGRGLGVISSRVVDDNAGYRGKGPPEIVQTVASMLGFENVITVPRLVGEISGRVDLFCTFLAADLIVVGSYEPQVDGENSVRLDQIAQDLAGQPTLAGPLRVQRITLPDHADNIWRSYTNIVFANGVVLVPVYPDYCPDLDKQALAFYRRLLPERKIVGINAAAMVRQGGSPRDVTLNVPVGGPLASTTAR